MLDPLMAPDYPGTDWMSGEVPVVVVPRRAASRWARLVAWACVNVSASDMLVAFGLLLLGRGCWLLRPAYGWLVPGAIIVWHALPSRPPFFIRPPRVTEIERHG